MRPQPEHIPPYYLKYINKIEGNNLLASMANQTLQTTALLQNIPEPKWDYRYADGKWSIKELLLHLTDTERIFAYRALRFSRNDKTKLAGFNQDDYVANLQTDHRNKKDLITEYLAVREATKSLFAALTSEELLRNGEANNHTISVLAIGFVILGHELHHIEVLQQRYLQQS